jgi:AraC family transcriptional regulator
MKRDTLQNHTKLANDIMYYIYTHIDIHIDIETLSEELDISKFYMHKIFKNIFGKNIYESIKSIRLQKAASLLLTNRYSTISEIAQKCGYSSHASFIKAFKQRFQTTPKEWRKGDYKEFSKEILKASNITTQAKRDFSSISPSIVKMKPIKSYYIRNNGYITNVKQTWQKLYTLLLQHKITQYKTIALLHDNPTITPLDECHYIASLATSQKKEILKKKLPEFEISGGIYAKFDLKAKKEEDLLHFIHWVYHDWLLQSEYETTTKPSFIIYHKNNYFDNTEEFDLSYYLSVEF